MKEYKLTEAEARELAIEAAKGFHKITDTNSDMDRWFTNFMKTYNNVMAAIDNYNSSVED